MSVAPLVSAYLTHLRAEGKSPATVDWHRHCLGQFARWFDAGRHPADPGSWGPSVIRGYLAHLRERTKADGAPLAPTSVNGMARSLRAFCSWLQAEGLVDVHPFARVRPPKAPTLVKPTLAPDEIHAVLRAAKQGCRTGRRDEAVLLFMLDTGARAAEVCGLRAEAVDWERRIAKLLGKGSKERYVPFSLQTAAAMQRYALKARPGGSDRFFESEGGRPLTPSGLRQLCERVGRRAGVRLHPHKVRHTFAITYLRNGASVLAVQKMLGHATLDVTLRYAALLTDDLVNEHRAHSPVAALLARRRS